MGASVVGSSLLGTMMLLPTGGSGVGGSPGSSPLGMMVPLVLVFGLFYFIVMLPAKKQQKKKDQMIAALKKGDRVVTSGGIHGTVAGVENDTLMLKISENTKIRVSKNAVAGLVDGGSTS